MRLDILVFSSTINLISAVNEALVEVQLYQSRFSFQSPIELCQSGYLPDIEALATELVLEQAKVLTEYEVSNS